MWIRSTSTLLIALSLGTSTAYGQFETTTYGYDSLGNRVSATNLIRFTDTRVFSFQPRAGLGGDRVNIFGRNLPPGDGAGFTVTINGVPATIISVATRVITIEVPAGASSGPLIVTLPDATQFDLGTFTFEGIIVSPAVSVIAGGQTVPFNATVLGVVDPSVTWQAEVVFPGDPAADPGTIDPAGLYTPPAAPEVLNFIVRATSVESPHLTGAAFLTVFGTFVAAPPASVVLPGLGDPGGLQANITVATPPTSVVLPGLGDPGGLQANVTIAKPPTSVVLPGLGDPGGLQANVTIAKPPVSVVLPGLGDPGGLMSNTTIGRPPLRVQFASGPP